MLLATTSATIPIAGRISTYTSGWARNQKRCCHKSGLPPPLTSSTWPLTTSPEGRKKLVFASRSISCSTAAPSSGGKAKSSRNDVTNCAQTKNGSRQNDRPGRPQLDRGDDEVDRAEQRRRDQEHHPEQPPGLARAGDVRERRVGGPARLGRAPGNEEAREHHRAAHEVAPVARHVDAREGHVGRADLQRQHEVAEAADRERHDAQEHHDRPVHRAELVVELRQHRAARHARLAEERADDRQRRARVGELPAHQHHQAEAEEQEQQAGDRVLDPDRLVVDGEDVLPPEAELLVGSVVGGSVVRGCGFETHLWTLSFPGSGSWPSLTWSARRT